MKLNLVSAIKGKLMNDTANGVKNWLLDLDLDDDGIKDAEEISVIVKDLSDGVTTLLAAVNMTGFSEALSLVRGAHTELLLALDKMKESIDKDKVSEGLSKVRTALSDAFDLATDIAENSKGGK